MCDLEEVCSTLVSVYFKTVCVCMHMTEGEQSVCECRCRDVIMCRCDPVSAGMCVSLSPAIKEGKCCVIATCWLQKEVPFPHRQLNAANQPMAAVCNGCGAQSSRLQLETASPLWDSLFNLYMKED